MLWRLIYALPNLLAAFGMLVVAGMAWRQRQVRGGKILCVMGLASSLWALMEGLSFVGLPMATIKILWQIQYFGVVSAPVLLVIFALQYVGFGHWFSRSVLLALAAYPALALLGIWTNDWHHWAWIALWEDTTTPFPTLAGQHGPLILMLLAYHYAVLLCAGGFLLYQRAQLPVYQRQQINLILWTGAIPMLASGFYVARIVPLRNMDLAPLAMCCSALLLSWGFLRERMLALIPVAHHEIYQGLQDAVLVLDNQNRVVDFNPAARQLPASLSSDVLGQSILTRLPELQGLLLAEPMQGTLTLNVAGRWFDIRLSALRTVSGHSLGRLLVWRDVSRYKRLENELRLLAATDSLTGLLNHRHFYQVGQSILAQCQRYGHALSAIMFDLDFFKGVNDHYGHLQGDAVLVEVARICRETFRASDICGRLGGEEFAVLLPETELDAASEVAERLRTAIRNSQFEADAGIFSVTASLGLAGLLPGESLDQLLDMADKALYDAKQQGRDRLVRG